MGQLHYLFHSLFDVAGQGGTVLLGKVREVDASSRSLTIRVTNRWPARPDSRVSHPRGSPAGAKTGKTIECELYGGVEWTDPNESPVEPRLAGHATAPDFEPGDQILLVSNLTLDAMVPTARNLQLVELAFDPERLAAYLESASNQQLIEDLRCPHLQKAALAYLERSGRPAAGEVIAAFDGAELRVLIEELFEAWDYPRRARFLTQALEYFGTGARRPWGERLALVAKKACDLVWDCQEQGDQATWEALGALCSLLDPRHEGEAEAMGSMDFRVRRLAEDDARTLSLAPLNALTASYLLFEYSDTGSFAYYLAPQLKTLTDAERAAFLDSLGRCIELERKTPRPRSRKLGMALHEVLVEAFGDLRSPEVDAGLAKIARLLGGAPRG